jgi:plasmid stabilization system protein ParE
MKTYRVVWDTKAKESLRALVFYISEASPTAARKVKAEILKLTASLKKMPERFSVEKYLSPKGSQYRSVTKWSYKIFYRVTEGEVLILEIIHTRKNITEIEKIVED